MFLLGIMVLSIMLLFGELLCDFTKKDMKNKEIEIVENANVVENNYCNLQVHISTINTQPENLKKSRQKNS